MRINGLGFILYHVMSIGSNNLSSDPISSIGTIITDVDNTILDTTERLRSSLRAIGHEEVFHKANGKYGGFKHFLTLEDLDKFWDYFLSPRFLDMDSPAPHAAEILTRYHCRGIDIVYLTGRHEQGPNSMRSDTLKWLERHNFPLPQSKTVKLLMKPTREQDDHKFKIQAINKLDLKSAKLTIGIGDLPHDVEVYRNQGIIPILITWSGYFSAEDLTKSTIESPGAIVTENWKQIETIINHRYFTKT